VVKIGHDGPGVATMRRDEGTGCGRGRPARALADAPPAARRIVTGALRLLRHH
jgi:hypothetical protein